MATKPSEKKEQMRTITFQMNFKPSRYIESLSVIIFTEPKKSQLHGNDTNGGNEDANDTNFGISSIVKKK